MLIICSAHSPLAAGLQSLLRGKQFPASAEHFAAVLDGTLNCKNMPIICSSFHGSSVKKFKLHNTAIFHTNYASPRFNPISRPTCCSLFDQANLIELASEIAAFIAIILLTDDQCSSFSLAKGSPQVMLQIFAISVICHVLWSLYTGGAQWIFYNMPDRPAVIFDGLSIDYELDASVIG